MDLDSNPLHPVNVTLIGFRIDALPSKKTFDSLTGAVNYMKKSVLGNSSIIDTSLCARGSTLSTYLVNIGPYNFAYKPSLPYQSGISTNCQTISKSPFIFSCVFNSVDTGVLICDSGTNPSLPGGSWSKSCRQDGCHFFPIPIIICSFSRPPDLKALKLSSTPF